MNNKLLEAPERAAIEEFLRRCTGGEGQTAIYEQVLGFLSGVVITPVRFMMSEGCSRCST